MRILFIAIAIAFLLASASCSQSKILVEDEDGICHVATVISFAHPPDLGETVSIMRMKNRKLPVPDFIYSGKKWNDSDSLVLEGLVVREREIVFGTVVGVL